uniref:Uncharacterized protein n=1 Tax=Alexandrium catenella TaxID=2925 RepID=A0A7S1RDA7_ALECA
MVQAALAAAQNPASAVRTLQMLQQASPAMPTKPSRTAQPVPTTAASAGSGPECQEALQFISSCQASGRQPLDAEIDWLVGLREQFRQKREFNAADELRNALRSALGVELDERQKTWTSSDGRQGAIPMWSAIAA